LFTRMCLARLCSPRSHACAQANISSSTASEDGTKCFKMLELFKAKYSKLVADKAMQARELILSEEQKLHISKALIEVKMANGEMAEKFETEKFEITNAMMNAKTEVSDLDIKLRDVEDQLLKSQDNERKAVELHTTIQKELGEQVNQGIETSAKLGVEMEKGTELGTVRALRCAAVACCSLLQRAVALCCALAHVHILSPVRPRRSPRLSLCSHVCMAGAFDTGQSEGELSEGERALEREMRDAGGAVEGVRGEGCREEEGVRDAKG